MPSGYDFPTTGRITTDKTKGSRDPADLYKNEDGCSVYKADVPLVLS